MNPNRDPVGELVRAVGRRNPPPEEAYERVLAAAQAALRHKLHTRRRRKWLLGLAAMITTVAIAAATFTQWFLHRPSTVVASAELLRGTAGVLASGEDAWRPLQVGVPIRAGSRVRTGVGAGIALKLNRGHSVRIDQQSDVELRARDILDLRTGAVYVDSGVDPQTGGVRIETAFGTVHDIGTIFEVRTAPNALRVRVREGRIHLKIMAQSIDLESDAGHEIVVDDSGSARRNELRASDPVWAWAESLAIAPEQNALPLLQFLTWVARETGRSLRFEDPGLEAQARDVVVHGKTRGLAPLEALDLMLLTTDFDYVLHKDDLIIIRRHHG